MSVFRVEKNKGYTVMSNHHLRNHALSLKAKGLLSQMLSLPDDWDYTLQGLAQINKESIDAIREAVRELERAGYIKRSRERDERGCLRGTVYTIYEQPHAEPTPEEPTQEKPALDNPTLEKPMLDKPTLENPTQLNTESTKKRKRQSKDLSITDSIPFPSGFPDVTAQKRTEAKESFERYRDLILENIDYDVLANDPRVDREQLDEIAQLVQETVCSTRSRIRVAGNDYPAEVVRSKLLKLNGEHIRFVMDCLKQNTTRIRNIRQYLLTMLFNAPSTMNSYYTALVAHDTRRGYAFLGWFTQETGGTQVDGNTVFKEAASTTYYAHWEEATVFSVVVPAVLPVTVDQNGKVYVSNAEIVNHSTAAVQVSSVTLTAENGWTLVPYASDMSHTKVDSNQIGFSIRDQKTTKTGDSEVFTLSSPWQIAEEESLTLTYDAVVSALSQPVTNANILCVLFVAEWA